jgi:hypothetical protein
MDAIVSQWKENVQAACLDFFGELRLVAFCCFVALD